MSSDSEEDNFCFYGKALEPYDEDAVPKKKPISIEDQIATDTQGRRRFHGAFTGGFSAGFYNTAGSLEGWKPSEFKSSRSDKAQSKQSKPEDFMDDEDIAEHGIAPQTVKATKDYATNRKRKKQVFGEGPIPGEPVLHTLITGGNETIGYLLMKNMDLKTKLRDHENIETEGPKVYGCIMPKTYEIKRNVEYESAVPSAYTNYITNPKSNTFGLGHVGLDKTHLNLFKSTQLVVKDKDKKLSISGQAFGVGAFENEDEDIYARDDMSQYDFEMTTEKKTLSTGIKSDSILEYFTLSKTPLLPIKKFQPPVIPGSFSGKHKVRKSRFEPIPEEHVERRDMNATIRAKYIGEEVNEPQPSTSSAGQVPQSKLSPISEKLPAVKEEEEERNHNDKNQAYGGNLLLDKFVSSSQKENLHNILEEVKRTETEHGTPEMRDAAKLKMYGPLTRIISDWQPCSLLCKRFNVREPLQDDRIRKNDRKKNHIIFEYQKNNEETIKLEPGLKLTKQEPIASSSVEEAVNVEIIAAEKPADSAIQESIVDEQSSKEEDHKVPGEESTKEQNDKALPDQTEKINVAKNINLFKAVFLSSSESESEGEDDKVEEEKKRDDMMKENVLNEFLIPKIKSNKEGILSHIKFNPLFKLNNSKSNEDENKTDNKNTDKKSNVDNTSKEDAEMETEKDSNLYGPVLPNRVPSSTSVSQSTSYVYSNIMDDEWVEKSAVEKKKSHKHKKKHKKEKRKKEHKSEHKSKHKK